MHAVFCHCSIEGVPTGIYLLESEEAAIEWMFQRLVDAGEVTVNWEGRIEVIEDDIGLQVRTKEDAIDTFHMNMSLSEWFHDYPVTDCRPAKSLTAQS